MTAFRSVLATACLAAAPGLAAAQQSGTAEPVISTQSSSPALTFVLRGGVSTSPEYFGSDDYTVGPDLGLSPKYGRIGKFEFGDPDPWAASRGFGLRGSFRYIPERDSGDYDELEGLDDIDAAYELGVGIGYTATNFSAFADVRRGFGGHESWVGEIGADVIARPTDRLAVTFGPRLFYGSDDYASTYFGVSESEAAASPNFGAYDADGGLLSAGAELGAKYRINDVWGVEGAITWDRFTNDAEDSPIVRQGERDQWGARIGITRAFSIGR